MSHATTYKASMSDYFSDREFGQVARVHHAIMPNV
jgi:hypothetical protein